MAPRVVGVPEIPGTWTGDGPGSSAVLSVGERSKDAEVHAAPQSVGTGAHNSENNDDHDNDLEDPELRKLALEAVKKLGGETAEVAAYQREHGTKFSQWVVGGCDPKNYLMQVFKQSEIYQSEEYQNSGRDKRKQMVKDWGMTKHKETSIEDVESQTLSKVDTSKGTYKSFSKMYKDEGYGKQSYLDCMH